MTRLIGYARVSTYDQNLNLQIDALKKAGCSSKMIFVDKVSGMKTERAGLNSALNILTKSDTLIVWRLDRLGRSISHLISLVEDLHNKGINFKSLCDGAIDTTTASGELVFNIFSSLTQFERRLIQERTRAGLSAARSRGRTGGRPKITTTNPKVIMAKRMHHDKSLAIEEICNSLMISRATFFRYLSLD